MPLNKCICIHGHFYQPPRENPWLEEVEQQDSAYPFHDWNERITEECYAPNTTSRILDDKRHIIRLVNNFSRISFNFGPTLLSWLARHKPETHEAIVEADKLSRKRFSGHGAAMAQCYNHLIMPLANKRDKHTQVLWGIRDFQHRFQRDPEGMWLPETAVDLDSLDIMAEMGIRFVLLSPRQASQWRPANRVKWLNASDGKIDPRYAYFCRLPSKRRIAIFFYDGAIARDIAFGNLLESGDKMAGRLAGVFDPGNEPQISHVATDGESYGHHHRFGDMALSYCLHKIESEDKAKLTVYGEFLSLHPPVREVKIIQRSSWSCVHGVERWQSHCGCESGLHHGWQQKWRAPLRKALDKLRNRLALAFETSMSGLVNDPWRARDAFIDCVLDREGQKAETLTQGNGDKKLDPNETVRLFKLLEMQHQAMLMYTSCGWFFDEISGIETTQILAHAARAIQLAEETCGISVEKAFLKQLAEAPSNIPAYGNGKRIYEKQVVPMVLDWVRIGAHFAVFSLFKDFSEKPVTQNYCYTARPLRLSRKQFGPNTLAVGHFSICSRITGEATSLHFASLHYGDINIASGIRLGGEADISQSAEAQLEIHLLQSDVTAAISAITRIFESSNFSIRHLFKDDQIQVMESFLKDTMKEVERTLQDMKKEHFPLLNTIRQMGIPLPRLLARMEESIHNMEILRELKRKSPDTGRLRTVIESKTGIPLEVDRAAVNYRASRIINAWVAHLAEKPDDTGLIKKINSFFDVLKPLSLEFSLWSAQNTFFRLNQSAFTAINGRAVQGDQGAREWTRAFGQLAANLGVNIQ